MFLLKAVSYRERVLQRSLASRLYNKVSLKSLETKRVSSLCLLLLLVLRERSMASMNSCEMV